MALPEHYGYWKIIYGRFRSWIYVGLFEQIFNELNNLPDMENLSLDSTFARAHQKATGAKKMPRPERESSYRFKSGRLNN